jgi:hypothetical protein
MKGKELVEYFDLASSSDNIDYKLLEVKLNEFLKSDKDDKVSTVIELVETVSELDWNLYQYRISLTNKNYSELYQMILSTYALNKKLGGIPYELTSLDIKLRSVGDTDEITSIINKAFVPTILNLIKNFNIDESLVKFLNVLIVTMKVCKKYHKKVKLTIDNETFRKIKRKYPREISYFGFTSMFTEDELKSKWRKLAMQLHPDRGGTDAKFIEGRTYYNNLLTIFD